MIKQISKYKYYILISVCGGIIAGATLNKLVFEPLFYKPQVVTVIIPRIDSNDVSEKPLEELVVNISNEYRTIVNKNEVEGINDLRFLANNANYEEAWTYIPSENKWIEIGTSPYSVMIPKHTLDTTIYASESPSEGSIIIDKKLVSQLIQKYDDIVLYHIHPFSEESFKKMTNNKKHSQEELSALRKIIRVTRALPSDEDMEHMIEVSNEFHQQNPSGRITFKIASPLGTTEYRLSNNGKKTYAGMDQEQIKDYRKKNSNKVEIEFSIQDHFTEVNRINDIISKYLNGGNYKVGFLPYSE